MFSITWDPAFGAQRPPLLQILPKALLNLSFQGLPAQHQASISPLPSSQSAAKFPGAEAGASDPSATRLQQSTGQGG